MDRRTKIKHLTALILRADAEIHGFSKHRVEIVKLAKELGGKQWNPIKADRRRAGRENN